MGSKVGMVKVGKLKDDVELRKAWVNYAGEVYLNLDCERFDMVGEGCIIPEKDVEEVFEVESTIEES